MLISRGVSPQVHSLRKPTPTEPWVSPLFPGQPPPSQQGCSVTKSSPMGLTHRPLQTPRCRSLGPQRCWRYPSAGQDRPCNPSSLPGPPGGQSWPALEQGPGHSTATPSLT